jgi:anti-anti-sigma regulatory factor
LSSLEWRATAEAGQLQNDLDVPDTRVALTGELDLATVQVLRAADVLMSETTHEITIDLGGSQFIDAAGLGDVIGLRMTLLAADRRLIPSQPSPKIAEFRHGQRAELI